MVNFLVSLVNFHVPVIALLLVFLLGFAGKVAACYAYDSQLDPAEEPLEEKEGRTEEIIHAFLERKRKGMDIRNTKAFVDYMLGNWKKFGMRVSRLERISEACGYMEIVFCAFFDMLLLTEKTEIGNRLDVMVCVYVYTALAVIFYAVLRLWEGVVALDVKRGLLSDGITEYIENRLVYTQNVLSASESLSYEDTRTDDTGYQQDRGEEKVAVQELYGEPLQKREKTGKTEKIKLYEKPDLAVTVPNPAGKLQEQEKVITQVLDEYLTS